MQRELEGFRNDGRADLAMWSAQQQVRLASTVSEMVETLRTERGLIAVMDMGSAVAVDPSVDLTDAVIERLGGSLE